VLLKLETESYRDPYLQRQALRITADLKLIARCNYVAKEISQLNPATNRTIFESFDNFTVSSGNRRQTPFTFACLSFDPVNCRSSSSNVFLTSFSRAFVASFRWLIQCLLSCFRQPQTFGTEVPPVCLPKQHDPGSGLMNLIA